MTAHPTNPTHWLGVAHAICRPTAEAPTAAPCLHCGGAGWVNPGAGIGSCELCRACGGVGAVDAAPATAPTTRPALDGAMQHPAPRAVHAINNAMQILLGEPDADDLARVLDLLADVPADVAALYECNEALEADLRGLRDQGLRDAHQITALARELAECKTRVGLAAREAESLTIGTAVDLDRATSRHTRTTTLRALLDLRTPVAAPTPTTTTPPHDAVAGA